MSDLTMDSTPSHPEKRACGYTSGTILPSLPALFNDKDLPAQIQENIPQAKLFGYIDLKQQWTKELEKLGLKVLDFESIKRYNQESLAPEPKGKSNTKINGKSIPTYRFMVWALLMAAPRRNLTLQTLFSLIHAWVDAGPGDCKNTSLRHALTTYPEFKNLMASKNQTSGSWTIATMEEYEIAKKGKGVKKAAVQAEKDGENAEEPAKKLSKSNKRTKSKKVQESEDGDEDERDCSEPKHNGSGTGSGDSSNDSETSTEESERSATPEDETSMRKRERARTLARFRKVGFYPLFEKDWEFDEEQAVSILLNEEQISFSGRDLKGPDAITRLLQGACFMQYRENDFRKAFLEYEGETRDERRQWKFAEPLVKKDKFMDAHPPKTNIQNRRPSISLAQSWDKGLEKAVHSQQMTPPPTPYGRTPLPLSRKRANTFPRGKAPQPKRRRSQE
jgi:hypothetical protein